jgi:hypothetical protein
MKKIKIISIFILCITIASLLLIWGVSILGYSITIIKIPNIINSMFNLALPIIVLLSIFYFFINLVRYILYKIKKNDKAISAKKYLLLGLLIIISLISIWASIAITAVTCCDSSNTTGLIGQQIPQI